MVCSRLAWLFKGFGQRHGVDCGRTFAPICCISSQRVLLCLAASLDVKTTLFLNNAPVEEDVWGRMTPGFGERDPVTGAEFVLKLRNSQHRMRQSPRNCNCTFSAAVLDIGFTAILSDPCVYVYGSGGTYCTSF